ncbi:hypothetical protein J7E68_03390 [Microbacterium sp. ISL-103]|uniref:hypothetical protein n=1 Tax=Microbacterium sp. ISL-103 TaxID=2819156 RepID=UPI001BE740C9|nr:hypothetical protein [Microbacterium sp. ISL-103]MBT2473643.1 hypothetical protein [Microbacterium sp. ISL-103]
MTNPWAAIVGPCYTRASLARALGWTEQDVATAVEALDVLEVLPVDGQPLYPAFQIADGRLVAGLADVLRTLSTGTESRWTWAQWLNSTGYAEESRRPIDMLKDGELDQVLLEARHDAWSWSS